MSEDTKDGAELDAAALRELDACVAVEVLGWQWWERFNQEENAPQDRKRGIHGRFRKALYPPEGSDYEPVNFSSQAFRPASSDTPRFSDWDKCCVKRSLSGYHDTFGLPRYSTDPAADYSVLVHVREKWNGNAQARFRCELEDLWIPRSRSRGGHVHFSLLAYVPGDYSLAALAAARARKGDARDE